MNEAYTSTRYETRGTSRRNHSETKRNMPENFSQQKPRNLCRDFIKVGLPHTIDNRISINPGKQTQIEPPFIEDRFSKTLSQPLVWYDKNRQIDSPYIGGAK